MTRKEKLLLGLSIAEFMGCIILGCRLRKATYNRLDSNGLIKEDGIFDTK